MTNLESSEDFTASGFNEIEASILAGTSLVLGVLLCVVGRKFFGLGPLVILAIASALVAAGARYSLRISTNGIELTTWQAWIFPVLRQRYLLDADVELHESLEADRPEGLYVRPPWGWGEQDTACFGPYFAQPRLIDLHRRARASLFRARLALRIAPSTPHFNGAPGLAGALDATGRTYWPVSGRLKSARLTTAVTIDSMALPEGSTIEVNAGEYIDPRRPDLLRRVILGRPCKLPWPNLPPAQAEAVLGVDAELHVHFARKAFLEPIVFGKAIIDGQADLSWNKDGDLGSFSLAAPLVVGDLTLPAGSRLIGWVLPSGAKKRHWYVNPATPLRLPQLTVGPSHSLLVTYDFSRVVGVMVDQDLAIDGFTLKGGVLHLPLDSSLRVDVKACRRLGLVR